MKIETKQEILNESLYILKTIVICSVTVFICVKLFLSPIHVDGKSMYPTLDDKDFGFSFVLGSLLHQYSRFDVVMIDSTKEKKNLVKRIIGLPNETIEYRDDKLYVNGKIVKEYFFDKKYVDKITYGGDLNFTDDFGPIILKENEYFLLGDNRQASKDSRQLGSFKEKEIISKYAFIIYPFGNINAVIDNK